MVPPSEYICIGVGILYFFQKGNLFLLIISASIANLVGTCLWYWLGKRHKKENKKILTNITTNKKNIFKIIFIKIYNIYTSKLDQIESLYKIHGNILLIFLRNVPVLRSIASYPAGRIKMPIVRFLLVSYIGILIWVCLWFTVGYFLGNIATAYTWSIAVGVGLISILFVKLILSYTGSRVIS